MVDIERLSASDFLLDPSLKYVDNYDLHDLYDRLAFKSNLLLVGPKGVGKTLSASSWCAKNKIPVIPFDCSEDARRSHLIGSFVLRDGARSPFVCGPIPTAYEVANEVGKAVLLFEEVNALTPQMQKLLNACADFRNRVLVSEAGRVFELRKGASLWIMGTMNTSVYGGVYALNEDLKSRFRMIPLDYPSVEELRKILIGAARNKPEDHILDKLITLAKETYQKAMEYPLSPRDLVQILDDIELVGLQKALWVASGKFEENDRDTFKARVRSSFAVQI